MYDYNNQPPWLDEGIESIDNGGCAGSPYLPAVTNHLALITMHQHSTEVLKYIESVLGTIPPPRPGSIYELAVYYLSLSIELFCGSIK